MAPPPTIRPDAARPMAPLNPLGLATLVAMELARYAKGWQYTVLEPVLTTLLFFAVFALTLGDTRAPVMGLPFLAFIAPGLVAMTALATAFGGAGWFTIDAKVTGTMDGLVAAPLRPAEFVAAYLVSAVTGGVVNGLIVMLLIEPFVPIAPQAPLLMLASAVLGCVITGGIGLITGIWAEKFDHVATVQTFVMAPLVFLSGAFFPVGDYGWHLDALLRATPIFWTIDGIRRGLTGVGEGAPALDLALLAGTAAVTALACHRIVASGWKLKR